MIPYTDNVLAPLCKGSQDGTLYRLVNRAIARPAVRTCTVAFAVLSSLLPLVGVPQSRIPAESVAEFEQAVALFQAGSYEAALRQTEPLGRRHPDVAEIQHLLAIALDLNGRPEEANQHFRRAVELQPESVGFRTNFGASLMRLGQASEAERQFRHALELEPNHPTASFNLGTTLLQQGRPGEALPWLEEALSIQPNVYQNAYQLAYCRFLLGKYEATDTLLKRLADPAESRAELQLLQALTDRALGRADRADEVLRAIRPMIDGQPGLEFQLALLLLNQNLAAHSEELLRSVTRQLPASYPAHFNLAIAQNSLGKLPEAIETATSALAIEETSEAHLLLADLLESQGQPVEAVAHFQKAVALDPTAENYFALGYEFLTHWNWEAAARVFSDGLERMPDSWNLWIGAGAAELGLTRYDQATRAFLNAVSLRPEEMMGFHLLSQAFDRSDEAFDGALRSFRQLLERNPTDPLARYFEALATVRQASRSGDSSEVATRLETLAELTQENPHFLEAQLLLGEIQFEVQNWPAAAEALQQAVRLAPDHPLAHYQLGLALQRTGQAQQARLMLQRYRELKAEEDRTIGGRVAATTRFIVEMKQDDRRR
ncbi:MAG: tetratricopeptide repeat protein [Bryobacterales bacterium]|nr:tetratricopeptide repeat protein [Bryobacterales bacterium]